MQIKNWPYRLFISSVSSCQLCCNRILASRLHKISVRGLWWFLCGRSVSWVFSCEIPVWLENVTNLCLSCWAQEFVSHACRGQRAMPRVLPLWVLREPESVVPIGLQLKMGGEPDLCMSAKTNYRAGQWGQWDPGASDCQGFQRGSNLETSHCNAKLIQTDGKALECVPVTIAMTWNKKWEIISVPGACSTISVPAEHFIAALMFYITVQWF